MISAYEMEKAGNAAKDAFSNNSYDPISADAWLNAQRRKMERQKRRAETFKNAKEMIKAWFRGFQAQNAASA